MPDRSRLRTLRGVLCLLSYVALGVLMVRRAQDVRGLEARAGEPLVGLLTTGLHSTTAVGDIVFFGPRTSAAIGLQITNECTTIVLIIPFLLIMGVIGLRPSVSVGRVLLATLIGVAMLVAVNIVRVAGIGWATYHWGTTTGYEVSHVVVGSLFALAGFALALVVAFALLVRGGEQASR